VPEVRILDPPPRQHHLGQWPRRRAQQAVLDALRREHRNAQACSGILEERIFEKPFDVAAT